LASSGASARRFVGGDVDDDVAEGSIAGKGIYKSPRPVFI
jgi:hypothetical protein